MSLQSRIEEAQAKYHWYTVVFLEETSQEELVNSGLKISHGNGDFTDRIWVSGFEVPERFNHVELFGLDLSNLCNNNLNQISLISAECLLNLHFNT